MTHAHGLQMDRRDHPPARSCGDLFSQPSRIGHVAAQALLQSADALFADDEPEFQRPEAAPERDAPVAQVLDLPVDRGLQEARVGRHHPHQMLGIAHVIDRAVERGAKPFVRVDHQRVRRPRRPPTSSGIRAGSSRCPPSRRRHAARFRGAARSRLWLQSDRSPSSPSCRQWRRLRKAGRRWRDPLQSFWRARRRAWHICRRTERGADCRGRSRQAARPCRPSYARAPTRRRGASAFRPAGRRAPAHSWSPARARR